MSIQNGSSEKEDNAMLNRGYPVRDEGISIQVDKYFGRLMNFIEERNMEDIKEGIKQNLRYCQKKERPNYDAIVNYYNRYSNLWGAYDPDKGIYDLVENRADALVNHKKDFEWLYGQLSDYRSKKILLNILSYWLKTDKTFTGDICDKCFNQYFDFDLIHCDRNEVFVDIGAYIGDTLIQYANMFGKNCYKRIYCYEIVPANVQSIYKNVETFKLKNVVVREKGVSDKSGFMYLEQDGISSVNQLGEKGSIRIPTVPIDDDIEGEVTFIKMDIEGGEESALLGCRDKIARYHPKLALSSYHNHKDLWKLARIISEIDTSYRFYLRYYGYALVPTEFVLYAL
ncbi:FkbM family methyltransferase [Lachnospiraceae bacterium 54-53]